MESNERYIRIGTTLYKEVYRPMLSGDKKKVLIQWNMETLRQDHTREFISKIEKYNGYCIIPSHTDYHQIYDGFLNQYEPIPHLPRKGEFTTIRKFLQHIFGEQLEFGMDYLQLLYLQPLQKLPILLLVSKERNTGKTTFLNFLKAVFADNMTFNTNEDFRSQFNSDWATKLIVGVDEVLLNRREDSERIKNLSTSKSYKAEAKGKDRNEVSFFAKFVLCSNNENNPIIIDSGEIRYWVIKVPKLIEDNTNILDGIKKEIPHFLWYLTQRKLSTKNETRMWFRPELLITPALKKIINYNRGKVENEMVSIILEIMKLQDISEYELCINDMADMLDQRSVKTDHIQIRRILTENWQMKPSEKPKRYICQKMTFDGNIFTDSRTGRTYTVKKEIIEKMND